MSNSEKIALLMLGLLIGFFVVKYVEYKANETDPLSSCRCEEGCEIHEFEHATCAIGPGNYSCCVIRPKE